MSESEWNSSMSIGRIAELACLLEVTASKPGNVHRGADFEDVTFFDFASSAVALGQAIDETIEQPYGETVLAVAQRTMSLASSNTNLGINLLVSLLSKACVENEKLSQDSVQKCLGGLNENDSASVFEAIRVMNPSGLGEASKHDVSGAAPSSLIDAMRESADRDRIAFQFVHGFENVFEHSLPWILEGESRFQNLIQGVVWAHVRLMAEFPDSLIARKCGLQVAEQSQMMAKRCIDDAARPEAFFADVADLDFWLRSDGHKRNPGTTADLIAAGAFVGLYNGDIQLPMNSL